MQEHNENQSHLEIDLISPSSSNRSGTTQTSYATDENLLTPSKTKIKKRKCAAIEDKANQILNVVSARLNESAEDEFSIVGKNIAAKLRKLSKETKIYTEKLINDLLFQAELGKVNEHTKIITEIIPPTTQNQTRDGYMFPHSENTQSYFSSFNPGYNSYEERF